MRKPVLSVLAMLCFSAIAFSQTTYYWTGAAGALATPTAWASGWNTAADGTGTARTVSSGSDILIIDGNTLATKTIYVGTVPKDSCAQLKLINGVTVTVVTTNASVSDAATTVSYGSTYGGSVIPVVAAGLSSLFSVGDYVASGTIGSTNPAQVLGFNGSDEMYISNEGNTVSSTSLYRVTTLYIKGNPGLTVDASSVLNVGASSTTTLQPFAIVFTQGAKGEVYGKVQMQSRSLAARISSMGVQGLVFKSGSLAVTGSGSSTASARGYVFGNPFVTGTVSGGNLAFVNDGGRVVFEKGATYQHAAQQNSPFGVGVNASSPLGFVPAISFQPASTYLHSYSNGYVPYFYSNGATFGNLTWTSTGFPGSNTTTFYLNPVRIDTLTFTSLASPASSSTSTRIPLYGDYVNNSTSTINIQHIIFAGNGVQQNIIGSNTGNALVNLSVLDSANVVLQKNLSVTGTVNVVGKLTLGTNTITGNGTTTLTTASAANKTYNQPAGSNNLSGGVSVTAGSTTIQVRGVSNINVGSTVSSSSHPALFPAGTKILSYNTGGNYTASQPAAFSADSASTPTLSLTFSNAPGTVVVSNAGGIAGAFPSFGTFTLGSTANYTFNTATTTPFPASITTPFSVGDLTANANLTLNPAIANLKLTVNGTLTLNNAVVTVPEGDTLRIASSSDVAGTFGTASHISLAANAATGAMSYAQLDVVRNVPRLLPVGNNGNYLPVTLTATTASAQSFAVNVATGATTNGLPNGTPVADKANYVDANYTVNRLSGTADVAVRLGFPAALKGSGFGSIQNHQLGIQHYNGSSWDAVAGNGDNAQNFATALVSSFSPFQVVVNPGAVLPVKLGNLTASKAGSQVVLTWKVFSETALNHYVVERTTDGVRFTTVGTVPATGSSLYSLTDAQPAGGRNVYRLKAVDNNKAFSYSKYVMVDFGNGTGSVTVSPNPVVNGAFTLTFGSLKAGNVAVKLYNYGGQLVMEQSIKSDGTALSKVLQLPANVAPGLYQLLVTDGANSHKASLIVH